MVHLERKAIYKLKYFILCRQKKKKNRENGKSTRKTQGKHREFCFNWSVATLNVTEKLKDCPNGKLSINIFLAESVNC